MCASATNTCEPPGGGSAVDAPMMIAIDAAPDAATMACAGTFQQFCVAIPSAPATLSGSIDTSTSNLCTSYSVATQGAYCVIAATSISAPGTVLITGSKPLVLLATGNIDIAGKLDVSSAAGRVGAGANSPDCVAGETPVLDDGGCGGSFGGLGGPGASNQTLAGPTTTPTVLRGGCIGGDGSAAAGTVGRGAASGGAIAVLALGDVTITGSIAAGGAGGAAGTDLIGGGGGGSGGMIVIEAANIVHGGAIHANGGGGGGAGNTTSTGGSDSTSATTAAAGGTGLAAGGAGSVGATLNGTTGANSTAHDSGGGGGAGVIKIVGSASGTGVISPPAT